MLHEIEIQILQLLAVVAGTFIVYLIQRAATWMNMKLSTDQVAAVEDAVNKVMSKSVVEVESVIREKGWDHVDSKDAVINTAMAAIEPFFKETLDRAGIDMGDALDCARVERMMERMWPDIATRLSASPATPPAPVIVHPI